MISEDNEIFRIIYFMNRDGYFLLFAKNIKNLLLNV